MTSKPCLLVSCHSLCPWPSLATMGLSEILLGKLVVCTDVCSTQDLRLNVPFEGRSNLWLNVLLKDTSAATGQAGIRTHILTTLELESDADRSTTTLRISSAVIASTIFLMWSTHIRSNSLDGKTGLFVSAGPFLHVNNAVWAGPSVNAVCTSYHAVLAAALSHC